MKNGKIKVIYRCKHIESNDNLYPLQIWYNQLIEKTFDELSVIDVLRMFQQKIFVELALKKAIVFLRNDIFSGELCDGELLVKTTEVNFSLFIPHISKLNAILENALEKSKHHEWLCDEDMIVFEKAVISFLAKSKQIITGR